jgi:hypothetical protein
VTLALLDGVQSSEGGKLCFMGRELSSAWLVMEVEAVLGVVMGLGQQKAEERMRTSLSRGALWPQGSGTGGSSHYSCFLRPY